MSVEEWMKENYEKVRIRSVVEKAEGVYSFWLERDSDREMLLGDRYRINRWHQFYIEEWISIEEWKRRVIEREREKIL